MTLCANALANSLSNEEYRKFRKSVNRSNYNKAVKYASTIDGCSGDNDIANRWHSHIEDLYNSAKDPLDPLSESICQTRVPANVSVCSYTTFIQVSDIVKIRKVVKLLVLVIWPRKT